MLGSGAIGGIAIGIAMGIGIAIGIGIAVLTSVGFALIGAGAAGPSAWAWGCCVVEATASRMELEVVFILRTF